MIPDLDIYRSANYLVQQHGEDAPTWSVLRTLPPYSAFNLSSRRLIWSITSLNAGASPSAMSTILA